MRQQQPSARSVPAPPAIVRTSSTQPKFWKISHAALSTILAASVWTAVLLFIHRAVFRVKLVETGDLATILFQVRDAERFRELLGNYSRWLFHHPGLGFMYILALGDEVFRRTLHLCPEPANAAFLTMLLLNAGLLFATAIEGRGVPPKPFDVSGTPLSMQLF